MGGHWITCPECNEHNRYPHDYMWFDEKGKVHDLNQWRCKGCGILFKKAEEKAFEKHMRKEQGKVRCK
jgi:Pyruvate/2-oxoacid:ferredoxin oxidoreductase delta subunit